MGDTFVAVCNNFRVQAGYCKRMGSPFYAALLGELSDLLISDGPIDNVLSTWPGDPKSDAVALRYVAALHYLVITEQDESLIEIFPPKFKGSKQFERNKQLERNKQHRHEVLKRAIREHEDLILEYLKSPPQTNEVGRSMVLLGGFLEVARRFGPDIDIFEIGASAGLNMAFDQYYYQTDDWHWGNPDSTVQFKPNWKGSAPSLSSLKIHNRRGCDLSPISASTQKDRLLSYIWPDQFERFKRIRSAVDYAKTVSPKIDTMEAIEWLKIQNDNSKKLRPRIFYHSIVWQYFSETQQNEFRQKLLSIGRNSPENSPVIWLRLEPCEHKHHAELRMNILSSNTEHVLAESDFHGEWVNWQGI